MMTSDYTKGQRAWRGKGCKDCKESPPQAFGYNCTHTHIQNQNGFISY